MCLNPGDTFNHVVRQTDASIRLTNCTVSQPASVERPGARGESTDPIDQEICQNARNSSGD